MDVDAFLETSRVVDTGAGVEVPAMIVNAPVHRKVRGQGMFNDEQRKISIRVDPGFSHSKFNEV